MGQASVSSLLQAINSNYPTSSQLRLQYVQKQLDRLLKWWSSGQSGPHDLYQVSGMLVGHLSMPLAPTLGVTRRASVDCHSNADAIWTTDHHDGKPCRGTNEGMKRLLL